ncbi:RNA polymerase sigma factor (sigma-70 family) [Paenibacillus endophyticus]|uniref:RNA polymerase sigma factor (Sigma-70 family) n=1 Tax=Paenibacillus endophyticus TaxID=1294268 RepID=A0A7W5C891_9BACL|nr:sigma-70 family RNA polymerase sigma factor [Paenibacillus endophyticus]MBB3152534.1 RNA polymerase sigma factor (sigma-70 family) [Paenibacillus endophyticus]
MTISQSYLSKEEFEQFLHYKKKHAELFKDRVVQSFFQNERHIRLLLLGINGHYASRVQLEEAFRKCFFEFRFVKYVASTIRFSSIDLMRSRQKHKLRNQLVFDAPVSETGGRVRGETLLVNETQEPVLTLYTPDPVKMAASFLNEDLRNSFNSLSNKQQVIATLAYGMCYQDNEIARMLNVSPQAVNKTRKKALDKIRALLIGKGVS